MDKKYIIFAPNFDENVGGAISMHRLCHLINENGGEAYLWHDGQTSFNKCKDFNTPEIYTDMLDDFIVVYMDVVSSNPINCPHVVRWFLNKPGFFTNAINYGENELYVYFQKVFNHEQFHADTQLYVAYFMKHLYKNLGKKSRHGSCYMLRKGRGRVLVHNTDDSILIDGLSHQEIAEIFNNTKYFYCYDLHSAYTYFASLCGCTPIVIPEKCLPEEQWQPEERLRYGVAYGESNQQIQYAIDTAPDLAKLIDELEVESETNVKNFMDYSQKFFASTKKTSRMLKKEELTYFDLMKKSGNKIVFYGVSESLRTMYSVFNLHNLQADYLCDTDSNKHNTYWNGFLIHSPDTLFTKNEKFDVLIASAFHNEIRKQLSKYKNIEKIFSIYD